MSRTNGWPTWKPTGIMLGQIAVLVEDWCLVDDVTTVDAVKLMLCDLEEHRAAARRGEILARYPTS